MVIRQFNPCTLVLVTLLSLLMPKVDCAESADGLSTSSEKSAKALLQGSIEHSEELPSLSDSLKPGSRYDENVLLNLGTQANNDWFWIPKWYGGKRHTEEACVVFRHDFNTGISTNPMLRQQERQDSVSGYQLDSKQEIWDFKNIPFIQHIESGPVWAVLYIKKMTPLAITNAQIVVKYEELSITYSKRDHRIQDVVQQEQINRITPIEPGVIRADISTKSFGWDGKPQRSEQSVVFSNVVEPFHQIDYLGDTDLRPLFRDYLISHHLENLVPEALKQ